MAQLTLDYTRYPTLGRFIVSQALYAPCFGSRGGGKCLRHGTPVMLYDGSLKAVEEIVMGDLLMGDDGTPRGVKETVTGYTDLVEVVPYKGDPFVVTWNHVMSLQEPRSRGQRTIDVPLCDLPPLLPRTNGRQNSHFWNTHYLFRAPVDFPAQPVPIDPYFLGLWLGDGHTRQLGITTMDDEVLTHVTIIAQQWGLKIRIHDQEHTKASSYCLTSSAARNPLYAAMRQLGFLEYSQGGIKRVDAKYIPNIYLCNSREVRLKLLAGLIDTDGYLGHNGYEVTQKNERLADDLVYLCRSLGLAAYKQKSHKSSQNGTTGLYYRVSISGECHTIPVKIPRKRATPRTHNKNVLHTSIKALHPLGVGPYAGFELTGNGRFLLGDFTVTHNTTASIARAARRSHAMDRKYWPLVWAIVRDTRKNIGLTIARSIKRWWPEPYAKWRGKPEEPESCTFYINDLKTPFVQFDFFGIDSPGDLNRLQSYEATGGAIIEEPCPVATNTEFLTSGVSESVLATLRTSLRAAPNPSIQIVGNMPSADHWTAQLWHLPGYEAAGEMEAEMSDEQVTAREYIRAHSEVFIIPPEECPAELETPGYREGMRQVLLATGRNDLVARLVDSRVGYAQVGERVTPQFSAAHLDPGIQVVPNLPMLLAFDFGLNPSCIAAQLTPRGYLFIHRAWSRANVGMKQLLELDVQPWLSQQLTQSWSYIGGHEATEREQSNSEETALKMIVRTLGAAPYRPGPVSWSARRDALHDGLSRTPGGITWVRVHPRGAALLVRALDGGWYYPTDASGRVRREGQPDKRSPSDHIGDAFAHLLAVLLRKTDAQSRSVRPQASPSIAVLRRQYEPVASGVRRPGV